MIPVLSLGLVSFVILSTYAGAQHRGTPEQQRACRPDVARFCGAVKGGDDAIADCLRANLARLRPACRNVIEGRR
jgi:Cysteine rich repeat